MYDSIIIGNGPAGITASIYIKRAGLNPLVIGKGFGALEKAEKIENYYGFEEPISGKDLAQKGIIQARRLGIEVKEDEVTLIEYDGEFVIKTVNNTYKAKTVILATGVNRQTPKIKGIEEYEGKGVSYCAICDAFFYRNKDVAVLGSGNYALNEINTLMPIAKTVTMITNGEKPIENRSSEIKTIEKKIREVRGTNTVEEVEFEDNTNININGLFIAQGVASSTDLAKKVGALTTNRNIIVNEKQETNLPGLYAAGDCTGGTLQIAKAVHEGMIAGLEVVKKIKVQK